MDHRHDETHMKGAVAVEPKRRRDKLPSTVSSAFEARILSGELAVGSQLPSESEIARQYGISTRSVREAIQVLETKGLVCRRHGERTIVVRDDVSKFMDALASTVRKLNAGDPDYLMKLMVVRRMIETEVVGILTEPEGTMNAAVGDALEDMRQSRERRDFSGFIEADAAFHRALVESARNEILALFYEHLYALIADVIRVSSRVPSKSLEAAYDEHASIFEKVKMHDSDGAKLLIRAHIDNSAAYLRVAIGKTKTKVKKNAV